MQILTIDVGTGTQDIFLYDSQLDLENGLKLVLPSPTMIVLLSPSRTSLNLMPRCPRWIANAARSWYSRMQSYATGRSLRGLLCL